MRRREALSLLGLSAAGVLLGCGDTAPTGRPGSTLLRSLADPDGDGRLQSAGPLALLDRTELGRVRGRPRTLATLAQLSDVHVRDAQSPGRVTFLDRLGPQFGSALRPHDTLSLAVLAAAVASINDTGVDATLVTGDLIDSAQGNELAWARTVLTGGTARPDSGIPGYDGVQSVAAGDPFAYRPAVDAPQYPRLLDAARRPVRSRGLQAPWHAALGNHDLLVQGEVAPSPAITAVATGDRLVVEPDLDALRGLRSGPLTRERIDEVLRAGLPGRAITVPADPARAHVDARRLVATLGGDGERLDRAFAVGDELWVIVLDLTRRDAGSGGVVTAQTLAALDAGLDAAGPRRVLVVSHQPLASSAGAAPARARLDADPRVVATVAGHLHRNEITPRRTAAGGYWEIVSASLVDFPQQWRSLRVRAGADGSTLIQTWTVDHGGRPGDPDDLAGVARDLAFLDPQGGRPARALGPASARNVALHLPPRALRPPARPPRPPAEAVAPAERFGAGDSL